MSIDTTNLGDWFITALSQAGDGNGEAVREPSQELNFPISASGDEQTTSLLYH